MSFIKDKQKELAKNRKEVKQLKYKLDEYIQKDSYISINNSSSSSLSSSPSSSSPSSSSPSSPYSVLSLEELPPN
jgi:activator of HSP90 ATPase